MSNILEEIAAKTKKRVERDKERTGLDTLRSMIEKHGRGEGRFLRALSGEGLSFICEIKKASPSKGIISEDFPYLKIARAYAEAKADAVSCLTEPQWFLGSDAIFAEIRQTIDTPMIRKDFTVDAYQIFQAKAMGADAVLLICAILSKDELKSYLALCKELQIDALVETHDEAEIETALQADARIIGVNNRNLKDFSVDFKNAERLRRMIPKEKIFVAESGVTSAEDMQAIRSLGADACLVGEALMRADDPGAMLHIFREAAR